MVEIKSRLSGNVLAEGKTIGKAAENHRSNLENADLKKACLEGVCLQYGNLFGADLSRAELGGTCFDHANLGRSDFQGACLQCASFKHSNLKYADFRGADLGHADFSGAELVSATFKFAEISNAYIEEIKTPPANDHYFISELLFRAAISENESNFAGRIRIDFDMCWDDFSEIAVRMEVDDWARETLGRWNAYEKKLKRVI